MCHLKPGRDFDELYDYLNPVERIQLIALEAYLYARRRLGGITVFDPGARPDRIVLLHSASLTTVLILWPPSDAVTVVIAWVVSLLLTITLNTLLPGH